MGLKLFSDPGPSSGSPSPPNPNPSSFSIVTLEIFGPYVVVEVLYPGCTTHNGRKVMVFRKSATEISQRFELDPHFLENDWSPIARFPATPEGRIDAVMYATSKYINFARK